MADDFTANVLTTGTFVINGDRTGNLEAIGDRDWFKGWLWAGHTYAIQERGLPTGDGTLDDTFLRLFNDSGVEIPLIDGTFPWSRIVDDGGISFNSYLRFVPETSGYYFVQAGSFDNLTTGTYRVEVAQQADGLARYNVIGASTLPVWCCLVTSTTMSRTGINPENQGF